MVDLQSSNRVSIASAREATFGVIPTSPVFKKRRVTSHGMATNPQTVVSNEIRSDRQRKDVILTSYQPGGTVAGEAAFQVMDDDLEEALQGTWSLNPVILVATIDTEISDVATAVITVASALGSAFKTGMLTLLSGFTTAANNGIVPRVSSSTATSITYPAASFSAEAAAIPVGAQIRVVGFAGVSGDLVAVTSGGNAITSTTLDFTTLGRVVGEWVRPNGFGITPLDNDFCRISAITAHRLSFDRVPTGWAADAGTAVIVSVYTGDFLINGSTKRSRTWERQFLDHSPVTYEYLPGEVIDKLTLSVAAAAIVTYSMDFVGGGASTDVTTRASGATDVSAPTNDVLNAASNVGRVAFDGSLITGPNYVMDATIAINNNLRRQIAVGYIAPVGIGDGEFAVDLTLNTYFGDKTILDKILNNTLTSFDIRIGRTDSNNESYVFDFPSIKLTAGSPSVSGKNADVLLAVSCASIVDATYGYSCSIGRFWYLP